MKRRSSFVKKKLATIPILALLICSMVLVPVLAAEKGEKHEKDNKKGKKKNEIRTEIKAEELDDLFEGFMADIIAELFNDIDSNFVIEGLENQEDDEDEEEEDEVAEEDEEAEKGEVAEEDEEAEKGEVAETEEAEEAEAKASDAEAETGDESGAPLPMFVKDGVDVVAIFADGLAQPVGVPAGPDSNEESKKVDTLWIYYSDNTFDQYAQGPEGFEIFSTGTYSFDKDGDFLIEEEGENGIIVINRNKKVTSEESGLTDYESSHEYELGTLGFEQLYGPADEGKNIEAVFGDDCQLVYEDEDGTVEHLDSIWIMFDDMSFRQYVFMDDDVKLYGKGKYKLSDGADFHFIGMEEESGTIILDYYYNMMYKKQGITNAEPAEYDLASLGLTCFYEKKPDEMPELPGNPPEMPEDLMENGTETSADQPVIPDEETVKAFEENLTSVSEKLMEGIEKLAGKYEFSDRDLQKISELVEDAIGDIRAGAEEAVRPDLPSFIKDGVDVVAVFADGQVPSEDLKPENADGEVDAGEAPDLTTDRLWIYYSDNTYDQYMETPRGYELLSTGTYTFEDDGDFIIEEGEDNGTLIENQDKKALPGKRGLTDNASTNERRLDGKHVTQLYSPEEEKKIEAILGDDNQLIYTDEGGVISHLDSIWIMYDDMSFDQYAYLDDEVVLYATGTYEFDEEGDFHFTGIEDESGKITLTYDKNILYDKSDKEIEPRTYDIKSLGLTCFFEKKADDMEKPDK